MTQEPLRMTHHLIIPTLCLVFAFCSMYFFLNATDCKFTYQFTYVPIGEAKAQKLIAEPKIIVSQDFKTTFIKIQLALKNTQ